MTASQQKLAAKLFSREQWGQVQSVLSSLDEQQTLWLSGFLAAQQPVSFEAAATSRVCIAYGGETGNSESLASRLGKAFDQKCITHQLVSLADVKLRTLGRVNYLIVICSTHGEGDPPETCSGFFEGLMSEQAPRLSDTQYAVLALGDSSYEHFCTAGKQIDERLAQLGASPLFERFDCDVDFENLAKKWMAKAVECLSHLQSKQKAPAVGFLKSTPHKTVSSRQNVLSAEVLENTRLSDSKRALPIHHIELLVEPGKLQLLPGDAVGIFPQNPPNLVSAIIGASGFSGEEPVNINKGAVPLVEALREHVDLCIPGVAFIKCWVEASQSEDLQQILQADLKKQRAFLRSIQIFDLLRDHPGSTEAQTFVDALRPLQPRLYDLANEITTDADELHLSVKEFQYTMNNRVIKGIASAYLLQLQPGETLRLYPHQNKRFHLPENNVPIIFIANATGIAPFRAFLQHLVQRKSKQRSWLIFQEKSGEEDFLYQTDIQHAAERGVLQHVDTLFTAEQPSLRLIDIFSQRVPRIQDWISRGAHLYFCGEKTVLGDCEELIKQVCEQFGNGDLWPQLVRDKRIHRNLY